MASTYVTWSPPSRSHDILPVHMSVSLFKFPPFLRTPSYWITSILMTSYELIASAMINFQRGSHSEVLKILPYMNFGWETIQLITDLDFKRFPFFLLRALLLSCELLIIQARRFVTNCSSNQSPNCALKCSSNCIFSLNASLTPCYGLTMARVCTPIMHMQALMVAMLRDG